MASKASTRAATIQDIQDENVLREMWLETQDADSKREIRSRMYKLREERLKEYYGREGIIENILTPSVTMEGMMAVSTTVTESGNSTTAVTMSGERDVVVISSSPGLEDGGEWNVDKEDSVRTRITKKDRALQYKEVKANQRITSTTTTTTTTAKVIREGESKDSMAVKKTLIVTTHANGLSNNSKCGNNMIANENGVREKRRGNAATTAAIGNSTVSQNQGRVSKSNVVVSSSTVRGNKTSSLEERENNINNRKRNSGESGTRRSRGERDSAETAAATTVSGKSGCGGRVTSPSKASKVTSKDTSHKSEKEVEKKECVTGGKGATVISSKAKESVGGREHKTDADVINRSSTSTNSAAVCVEEEEETRNGLRATTRANKTSITSNGYSNKDKTSGTGNKSRESSPKSRLPTSTRAGSIPPRDKETETKSSVNTTSSTTRGKSTSVTNTPLSHDEPEKVKAEESIIRELDILDNFLSQRSTSIDEGPAVREESTTVAATVARLNGTMGGEDKRDADVMEMGLEPPFTKTSYKYNCPGDDDHDHHHHPRRPTHDRNTNEKKKSQQSPTREPKGNFEDEIITESVVPGDAEKGRRKAGGKDTKVETVTRGSKSTRSSNVSGTTSRVRGERDSKSSADTNVAVSGSEGRESRGNQRRKPTVSSTTAKMNSEVEEPRVRVSEFKVTESQSKQQKYEADILSRPSVFEKRKSRPEPNPRLRKSSDSSPERTVAETKGRQTASPRPQKHVGELIERDFLRDNNNDEPEEDDDPLKPQKRFESRGKGLESPGAVLKAKSLFETKAQEAAVDRSSADFDSSLTARGSFKVSKKAALFEARSRGERVSVSSESSLSHPQDDKDLFDEKEIGHKTNVENTMNKVTVEDSVFTNTKTSVNSAKVDVSNTTIGRRRQSREKVVRDDAPSVSKTVTEKRTVVETARKERAKVTAPKQENVRGNEVNEKKAEKVENTKTVTARKSSRKLDVKAEDEGETVAKQERPRKPTVVDTEMKKEVPTTNRVKNTTAVSAAAVVTSTVTNTTTTTTTTTNTNRRSSATATEINFETIENVEELEILLDKATDYDERSKIRARIRIVKRKSNLDKEKEKEKETTRVRSDQSPTRKKTTGSTTKTSSEEKSTAERKPYEGRKSSGEIPSNKVTTRKKSKEISESAKPVSKPEECIVRRRSSSTTVKAANSDNNEGKIGRRNSRDKDIIESSSPRRNSQEVTDSSKRSYKGKENQTVEEKSNTVVASVVEDVTTTTSTRKISSRKNSAETNELLSTRKYSRERRGSADEENNRNETKKGILSRENSRDKNIQSKSTSPAKTESPTPKKPSESRNLRESNVIESASAKKQVSSRTVEVTNRKGSRDASPPKILNSVPENSATSQTAPEINDTETLISSRGPSPSRTKRDSVSPQRTSGIPLSTRRYSRDSCSPPKSPGPDIGIVEEPQDSETETKKPEIVLPENPSLIEVEEIKEPVVKSEPVASSPEATPKTKKTSSRKNSEELFSTSNSRRGSTDQSKGTSRKKSSEEPNAAPGGKRNSYSRKGSSKELKASEEKNDLIVSGDSPSRTTAKGKDGGDKERERSRDTPTQIRKQSNAESNRVSSSASTPTPSQTPTQKVSSSTTSTRRQFGTAASTTSSSTTTTSSTRNASKVQGTDTVTSSYGVGPTDDDGQPLFGLRALRKIKQVQEQMASEKAKETTSSPTQLVEEDRKASVRSNDMYGLRALKKGSSTSRSYATSSTPERGTREKNSSSPTKEISDTLTSTTCGGDSEERYTSSPKSILKKTSSFTSNKSESKTDVDAVGLSSSSTNISTTITQGESVSSTFSSSVTSTAHVSRTTSTSSKSKEDWLRKSKSPEPSSATALSLTGSLSRGKVGRSSVREMSRRFEGPSSLESDTSTKNGVSDDNVTIAAARKTMEVYSETSNKNDQLHDSFADQKGSRVTKTTVVTSATRSFLSDRTPVKDLSDVMQRMKGDPDEGIGHDGEESDLSLLNKFIGAQIIMQGVEPLLVTTTTKVSMSQSLCINGVDVGQETDPSKLKQLLEECEGEEERGIIQNRLKSLGEIESNSIVEIEETTSGNDTGTVIEGVSSADVTGELMPLILGQLQSSLDNLSASGGGGGSLSNSRDTQSGGTISLSSSKNSSSSLKCGGAPEEGEDSSEECLFDSGTESGEDLGNPNQGNGGSTSGVGQEDPPAEFSSFMQGLRNSLQNSAGGPLTSDAALVLEKLGVTAPLENATSDNTEDLEGQKTDANLIQQVDSVLSLLRESLVKDPNCLNQKSEACERNVEVHKGKELIALIDRLKDSLSSGEDSSGKKQFSPLPTVVGRESRSSSSSSEMAKEGCEIYGGWSEPRPPDLLPLNETQRRNSNPWTNNYYREEQKNNLNNNEVFSNAEQTTEIPWKVRAAKRRTHARSHTVGVSVEELAEARRYLEEQAMRNAMFEEKQASKEKDLMEREKIAPIVSPLSELIQPLSPPPLSAPPVMISPMTNQNWQSDIQKRLTSVPRPFVKGDMYKYPQPAPYATCDDSSVVLGGIKLKPFRTFSLDNNNDPSKSLFTPEETVQIAIHKAAIKKQMSEEEDRRKRRNSLTSYNNQPPVPQQPRDFSLALPKPYSPPQNQSGSQSGSSGNSPNTKSVSYPLQSADSGFNEDQICRNDQVLVYEASQMSPLGNNSLQQPPSPKRIENVQISLKELNSSEFPQLQIAITLNTNNNTGGNTPNNISNPNNVTETSQSVIRNANNQQLPNNLNKEAPVQQVFMNPSTGEISGTSVQVPASNSKICRYKTKTERKKKMKRANTIDIPHPPGYLFSGNDEDTGMDDEEESDSQRSSSHSNLPFKAKTEGDKKFLAFLEKNNALAENRPARPSYLSVNDKSDKFWNNRFFNLKTSFESSSQGSSPSVSPSPLSPGKAPRSVSELALTHGRFTHDVYSKPVWANTDPAQLPPQVKNKLHVFENKMMSNSGNNDYSRLPTEAWRSPPPTSHFSQPHGHNQNQYQTAFARRNNNANNNNTQHRSSLIERKMCFENKQFDVVQPSSTVPQNVQKPVAMKPKGPPAPPAPGKVHEGVHMVHATASALQAMKKSNFVPPPPAIPPRTSHPPPPQVPRAPPPEKIDLPWAKKDVVDPNVKDDTRIKMSKALFEQVHKPVQTVQPTQPPPIPAKPKSIPQPDDHAYFSAKRAEFENFQKFGGSAQNISTPQSAGFTPVVTNRVSVSGPHPNMLHNSHDSAALGGRPKLGVFGVTRSFDEAVKQKYESAPLRVNFSDSNSNNAGSRKDFNTPHQQHPHHTYSQDLNQAARGNNSGGNVSISGTNKIEFQRSPASAFVRQVSTSEPTSRRNSEDKPLNDDEASINTLVLTPVVSKVMRGPTQQRATVLSNRMSSLNDESQQPSRLTNARSNIRSILNQYHPSVSISPGEDSQGSSDASPPIIKGNLQLTLPPLVKSHSGDAVLQTNFRPPTNSAIVMKEEVVSPQPSAPQATIAQPVRNAAPLPARKEMSNPAIPRQASLAEFPVRTPPQSQLTIEIEPPTPPTPKTPPAKVAHQQQPQFKQNKVQSTTTAKPSSSNQQKPNTLRTFPAADLPSHHNSHHQQHLQRTSSGSSIFNRTQHLFISAHDTTPPQTKLRPKPPPSLPRSQVLFPKQFEAQMSPDSADKKKREIEEYFRQQSQSKQKQCLAQGSQLRKSASHSKIMHRQRSISDGEDDVDQIFESLFKASGMPLRSNSMDSKAKKSAEAVVSVSVMSSQTVQCQQQQKVTSSTVSSSSSTTAVSQSRTSVSATSSSAGGGKSGGGSPFAKFKQMDQQTNPTSGTKGAPLFKFTNQGLQQSASSAKDVLLYWCQCRTRDYQNIKIENFSSSWSDGLAFCALIHHFYPDAFDYDALDAKNRRYNFDLAFRIADEKAGIYPLLDTEDMVAMGRRPDWKCVFTYVQSMYRKLKELA